MFATASPCETNTLGRYDQLWDENYVDFFTRNMESKPQSHQIPFEIYRGSPELFAIPRYSEAGPDVGKKYVKLCDVADGTIEMHVYQPSESAGVGPHPVYINYHGGGFVGGAAGMDEPWLRMLVTQLQMVVIDVDYRLAPEFPAPIPANDAFAALELVIASAVELNIDTNRISVGGISAGANLATVTAIRARDAGIKLIFQLLVVPVTDADISKAAHASWTEFADNPVLSYDRMAWFYNHYIGAINSVKRNEFVANPSISPIRANLEGLPPTFVATAEVDILRDEGKAYADLLKQAGVKTQYDCYLKMPHTFLLYPAALSEAKRLQTDVIAAFREILKS